MMFELSAMLAGLLLAGDAGAGTRSPLALPCGGPPLIDGRLDSVEWAGSREILIGSANLMIKADAANLYVGIRLPKQSYRYLDLYVEDAAGQLLNLHASFKQGQRLLTPGWSDGAPQFEWNPKGWDSSISRRTGAASDAPIAQQIGGLEGYEMRVPMTKLGRPPLKIRAEVRDFEGTGEDWVYPQGSTRENTRSWAELRSWPACK